MYNKTAEQIKSEKTLEKRGFNFSNWISARSDDDDQNGIIIMSKKIGYSTHYREIEPNGDIIGDVERSF